MRKIIFLCTSILLFIGLASTLNSCKKDKVKPVSQQEPEKKDPPKADFTMTATNGWYAPCVVTFESTSKNADEYRWDSPNITFNSGHDVKTFKLSVDKAFSTEVSLTVSNKFGVDKITKTFEVMTDPNKDGYLTLISTSSNPYDIYINGVSQGEIKGKASKTFKLQPKQYTVRVVQKSGYVFYATDETYNLTVYPDKTTTKNFPN